MLAALDNRIEHWFRFECAQFTVLKSGLRFSKCGLGSVRLLLKRDWKYGIDFRFKIVRSIKFLWVNGLVVAAFWLQGNW